MRRLRRWAQSTVAVLVWPIFAAMMAIILLFYLFFWAQLIESIAELSKRRGDTKPAA